VSRFKGEGGGPERGNSKGLCAAVILTGNPPRPIKLNARKPKTKRGGAPMGRMGISTEKSRGWAGQRESRRFEKVASRVFWKQGGKKGSSRHRGARGTWRKKRKKSSSLSKTTNDNRGMNTRKKIQGGTRRKTLREEGLAYEKGASLYNRKDRGFRKLMGALQRGSRLEPRLICANSPGRRRERGSERGKNSRKKREFLTKGEVRRKPEKTHHIPLSIEKEHCSEKRAGIGETKTA